MRMNSRVSSSLSYIFMLVWLRDVSLVLKAGTGRTHTTLVTSPSVLMCCITILKLMQKLVILPPSLSLALLLRHVIVTCLGTLDRLALPVWRDHVRWTYHRRLGQETLQDLPRGVYETRTSEEDRESKRQRDK